MQEDFFLSQEAINRINFLINKRNDPNIKFRVSVESGGCSGFQYKFELVSDQPSEDDYIIQKGDVYVLIDKISLEFIKGSSLAYNEDLNGSYFFIKNPQAASGCGCGNSFSI